MTASPDWPDLPIARYRFTARLRQSLRLPDYAGSLLRGQFGAALRHLACMTRQPTCGGCPLQTSCPYTRIFEALPPASHTRQTFSAIPNAYVVEPPAPMMQRPPVGSPHPAQYEEGQKLVFHMVLTGVALEQLPLVIYAWQRALAYGLTKSRSPADLVQVEWLDGNGTAHSIWNADHPHIAAHSARLSLPPAPAETRALQLHIHTPLRLQHQNRPIKPAQLTPKILLAAIASRITLMLEFHAHQPQWSTLRSSLSAQAQQLHDSRDLHWFDWIRYSSRQRQEMTLGGVLGRWTLHGPAETLASAWPWLWLGQWLHVGKNASFGLGGYVLEHAADNGGTAP